MPASPAAKGGAKIRKYTRRDYMGLAYISIWVVGMLLFQLYPFFSSLYYSFTNYNIAKADFVGISNYVKLFTQDAEFFNSVKVTALYTLMTVPGKLIMALLVALILNTKLKGINLVRTVYYLPSLMGGSIAVSILWKLMFADTGIVNNLLSQIGLPSISWLGSTSMALPTICMLEIWQFGSSMVLMLAALKQVPAELYEAASIDGAKKLRQFFVITFPQISPIVFFNLIMQTIQAMQNFTSAFVVTNGGPMKATYVLGMKLYADGFSKFKMGYASATSWVIFVMIVVVTLILFGTSRFWVSYSDED